MVRGEDKSENELIWHYENDIKMTGVYEENA